MTDEPLGDSTEFEILKIKDGNAETLTQSVAAEVPCTIVVNGVEVVTAMVTPTHLEEFAVGHLFTAGIINSSSAVTGYRCDETKWRLDVETSREIDLELLGKRLYTSGCGKGVMYANVIELSSRQPLAAGPEVGTEALVACMKWLLSSSALFHATHGVHSVAISIAGDLPDLLIDDIGRHNAVDKIIGHSVLHGLDFSKAVLLSTGRTSAEILHKAKRAGIPILLSRGAPTHQTILLAREMGVTVASFGRSGSITVYSSRDRVLTSR
jgi:FdhD protein